MECCPADRGALLCLGCPEWWFCHLTLYPPTEPLPSHPTPFFISSHPPLPLPSLSPPPPSSPHPSFISSHPPPLPHYLPSPSILPSVPPLLSSVPPLSSRLHLLPSSLLLPSPPFPLFLPSSSPPPLSPSSPLPLLPSSPLPLSSLTVTVTEPIN